MTAPIVLRWPGGEHAFRLGLGDLEVVQANTDCGPEFLLHRINMGGWKVADLMEVLRNGLIGGGMDAVAAKSAVESAFDRHALISFKAPAQAVLSASLFGPPDDQPGEDSPAGDPTQTAPQSEGNGNSAHITDSAP